MSKSIQTHVVGSTANTYSLLGEVQVWNVDLRKLFSIAALINDEIEIRVGKASLTVSFVAANASKLAVDSVGTTNKEGVIVDVGGVSTKKGAADAIQGFLDTNEGATAKEDAENLQKLRDLKELLNPTPA